MLSLPRSLLELALASLLLSVHVFRALADYLRIVIGEFVFRVGGVGEFG